MTMAQPRLFITLLLPLWSRPEKSLHTVARRRYFFGSISGPTPPYLLGSKPPAISGNGAVAGI